MDFINKLRSYRIGPFAIFDFATAYGAAWFGAPLLKNYISRTKMLYLVVPTGVLSHLLLGTDTPLNRMLFNKDEANWVARIAVTAMIIAALTLPK